MHLEQQSEFNGFLLTSPIELDDRISILIGQNGCGKTRFLQSIANRRVSITRNGTPIGPEEIVSFPNGLQPALNFAFDLQSQKYALSQAASFYAQQKGRLDGNKTHLFDHINVEMARPGVDLQSLAYAVRKASIITGKDINNLDGQDIADFYSTASTNQIGAINFGSIAREYLEKIDTNSRNEHRNDKHGLNLPYWPKEEFEKRFGPPPWEVFNQILHIVFEGRYRIDEPSSEIPELYNPAIRREDGRQVDPTLFSSGEKTLLWLCLSMYGAISNPLNRPIKVILLDEPDATLHPGIIRKLHYALDFIHEKFQCSVILTTHSPTTVALSSTENIFKISETTITQVDRDTAVAELLDGVDQISIHYSNRRQVYVEGHHDATVYTNIFSLLRRRSVLKNKYIHLSFIPAAPKLAPTNIKQTYQSIFGEGEDDKVSRFVEQLNGQGNSVQVIGTVQCLTSEGNQTVHGIIDWDRENCPTEKIHVHAKDLFYSIENAVLNPLTLGLYLLSQFPKNINKSDIGISDSISTIEAISGPMHWQAIIDWIAKEVLQGDINLNDKIECTFANGTKLGIPKTYAHYQGHKLQELVIKRFPFLNRYKQYLLEEIIDKETNLLDGRSLPNSFIELFQSIQER
jgi:predicted ATPase